MDANRIFMVVFTFIIMFVCIRLIFLLRGSFTEVLNIFREKNALDEKNARDKVEFGFNPQSVIERMYKLPDYKPLALQVLILNQIVRATEDERLYLSEEKLASFHMEKKSKVMSLVLPLH